MFEVFMLKSGLAVVALVVASQGAWAQQSIAAGGELQQIPSAPIPAPTDVIEI
jgi:hypothetical protein